MWNRACPLCFARVPRSLVLAHSQDLACPACHAALEISRPSRLLGSGGGLVAAVAASHLARSITPIAPWISPLAAAMLGFGLGSALLLFFICDLVVRPKVLPGRNPHSHQ
jgi:hypothetical protein